MFKKIKSDILSGIATACFSIPEGMAYAKLAGVNPIYGLYSGMVATITASLTTGTVLMMSTLTSAIALSTHSVLNVAKIEPNQISTALFTLTFMMGAIMFLLGVLRLGKIVNFVSNAVMTGFIVGASFLILVGELGDLVGYDVVGQNKFMQIINWITHIGDWDLLTTSVGVGSIAMMFIIRMIPSLRVGASVFVLAGGTLLVYLLDLPVKQVKDIATVTGALPTFNLPDIALMPRLALGAISVSIVALVQGAGVSIAIQNPDEAKTSHSRDFIGQGLGNLVGSFFQSMGTGGSLSRTAISVSAGAKTRLGGVFAGLWLILAVSLGGGLIGFVPLSVMSGILVVVAFELIKRRVSDIRLILTTSLEPSIVMIVTFLAALFIHLQWTIFLGAGMSLLYYIYTSSIGIRLVELVKNEEGYFEERPLPKSIPSNKVTILDFEGNFFFAEVPVIKELMPSTEKTTNGVLIWRIRGFEDVHSSFLKWMEHFAKEFHAKGNKFVLEGVEPEVMKRLENTEILEVIGRENVYPAKKGLLQTLAHVNKIFESNF